MRTWAFPWFLWSLVSVLPASYLCFSGLASGSFILCARPCQPTVWCHSSPECILSLSLKFPPLWCPALQTQAPLACVNFDHCRISTVSLPDFVWVAPLIFFPFLRVHSNVLPGVQHMKTFVSFFFPLIFCVGKVGRVNKISQLLFLSYSFIS